MKKAAELRKKYPEFIYRAYSYEIKKGLSADEAEDLHISFDFEVGDIRFKPRVVIKGAAAVAKAMAGQRGSVLENLIFHLGLAEMPSYWKATASPNIIIEAGSLNKTQINWWHDLFMRGMGQYFYENKIDFTKPNFLTIQASPYPRIRGNKEIASFSTKENTRTLVPIGGGKDAIVTYEILKKAKQDIRPFILNPKGEHLSILRIAGAKDPIIVQRALDPKLFELNRKGYLNGHTPFSAYLAFLTTLCAALFDYKYIALSNERSSNEGNVEYLDSTINHQYSKSFDFEKKFRAYSKKYLAENVEYFSFLRPLYELQIAKLFSRYPKYFGAFLSCNEAHKTNSGRKTPTGKWCGKCSKCLFVFACLYPFVEEKQLVKIFKKNLLEDKSLIPIKEELTGKRGFKPFECVGTTRESITAFAMSDQKQKGGLYAYPRILQSWNTQNFLPKHLGTVLRNALGPQL